MHASESGEGTDMQSDKPFAQKSKTKAAKSPRHSAKSKSGYFYLNYMGLSDELLS